MNAFTKALRRTAEWLRRISLAGVIAAVGGVLAILAEALLCRNGADPMTTGITILVAYACLLILTLLVRGIYRANHQSEGREETLGGGIAMLQKLPLPLLLCRENGEVLWKNEAFRDAAAEIGEKLPEGEKLSRYLRAAPSSLSEGNELSLFGKAVQARSFVLPTRSRERSPLYALVFEDREALRKSEALRRSENPVVAYVMIDNLDDVIRMSGTGAHTLTASIAEELNRFADSVNGLLLEIEKDKYCLIFSEEGLDRLCRERFDVLDRIAAIRTGERSPITVTASIGVGTTVGSLAEREESAQSALNYALQDGGACAVVRGRGKDLTKYGGNTKAVQSSSKVRSRTEGERLLLEIEQSDRVIIMGHRSPDFDCLASSVGLAKLALSKGVPTMVVLDRAGYNIRRAIPCIESLSDLDGIFVDAAKAQDSLTTSTLLILTDVSNPELFESPELEKAASRVAYIDHHRRSEDFERTPVLKYIDSNASSASELLSEMLEACLPKGSITTAEAELLLAGIMLDTKNFTIGAGPRTFGAAQYLKGIGADPMRVQELYFSPDMEEMRRQSAFESSAALYREGVVIAVNREDGIQPSEDYIGSKAADHLLTVKGVEATFVLFRIGNTIRIKARSAGKINVQAILSPLGGGGHFEAAANRIENDDLESAVSALEKAIDDYFADNQK